jgi:RecB family endonuclease NucS
MEQLHYQSPIDRAPLEKDIQNFLEANPSVLGNSLEIIGKEYPVPFGRIDLLAKDKDENLIVIELKLGVATRDAIGQLQSYMGAVQSANPENFVRGILVAAALDQGADAALSVARDISFTSYTVSFNFLHCKASESTYESWLTKYASTDVINEEDQLINETNHLKKTGSIWLPPGFKR